LSEQFGVCNHVNKTTLVPPVKDSEIGKYAKENGYVIVTHDSDLINLQEAYRYPPKVILLKTENIDSKNTLDILLQAKQSIIEFCQKEDYGPLDIMKGNLYD
jgi:predicted nuclease of predicted toxin-antitoxin system